MSRRNRRKGLWATLFDAMADGLEALLGGLFR